MQAPPLAINETSRAAPRFIPVSSFNPAGYHWQTGDPQTVHASMAFESTRSSHNLNRTLPSPRYAKH